MCNGISFTYASSHGEFYIVTRVVRLEVSWMDIKMKGELKCFNMKDATFTGWLWWQCNFIELSV